MEVIETQAKSNPTCRARATSSRGLDVSLLGPQPIFSIAPPTTCGPSRGGVQHPFLGEARRSLPRAERAPHFVQTRPALLTVEARGWLRIGIQIEPPRIPLRSRELQGELAVRICRQAPPEAQEFVNIS
jgi:hypothetical protein